MAAEAKPGNGYDGKLVKGFIKRIEELDEEVGSIMGKAMREAKERREDIKSVFAEAKDKGVPIKVLKAEVKLRKLDRDKSKIVSALDQDDADTLEMVQAALGDFASLPLGRAAIDAVR